MVRYCITSFILNAYEARIVFDYYLPENNMDWQDRFHGSIDILGVVAHGSSQLFDELPIIDRIHIRRTCWHYLEAKGVVCFDSGDTFIALFSCKNTKIGT